MKWLGSYRYGVFNLGADSVDAMHERFRRVRADFDFHASGVNLARRGAFPAAVLGDD